MKSISEPGRLDKNVKDEIKNAVSKCVDSGWYILGENVRKFEEEFAAYTGTEYCVSTGNGTEALYLALKAEGAGSGDEVITTANAGFYSSLAIISSGAKPVYADIKEDDYLIDPEGIEKYVTGKTKALIVTHLFGRMADMEKITGICGKNGVIVIEDCAQAHGAERNGRKAGSFGAAGCFSFYPTKNLGAMGDGGCVATSDKDIAEKIRELRQYGWKKKYIVSNLPGINSRLDEMQAAVLRIKLKYLDEWNSQRRRLASFYSSSIKNEFITALPDALDDGYVAHLYVVRSEKRDSLAAYLKKEGVPCDIHYPVPDYKQEPLRDEYKGTNLRITEKICPQILTLPCFPGMTDDEAEEVADKINKWRPE